MNLYCPWAWAVLALFWPLCVFADDAVTPAVRVSVSKTQFVINEPIEIIVEINNPTDSLITLDETVLDEDQFSQHSFVPSMFLLSKQDQKKLNSITKEGYWRKDPDPNPPMELIGKMVPFARIDVPPKSVKRFSTYLQYFTSRPLYKRHFTYQPSPGRNTLVFDFDSRVWIDKRSESLRVVAKGELNFTLEPATTQAQHKALRLFVERFKNGRDKYDKMNALFALSTVNDPIVIDHLGYFTARPDHYFSLSVFRIIDRFSKDPGAICILLDALEGQSSELSVSDAIDLCFHWHYRIPHDVLRKLRTYGDEKIMEKLEAYREKRNEELKSTY